MDKQILNNERLRGGFTLIELLVVLAIVMLLAAMLLPALAAVKAKGRSLACLNNGRQLGVACLLYADEANDRLPYNLGAAEIKKAATYNYFPNWTTPVLNWELDSDNTNSVLLTRGGIGAYVSRSAGVYVCPEDRVLSDIQLGAGWSRRVRSWSMNMMMGDAGEYSRGGVNSNNPAFQQFFKVTQVTQPSRLFVFIEEHPDSINDGYFNDKDDSYRWIDLPASWHNGGANLSFADGHMESRKWLCASTRAPARPDGAQLPFDIPAGQWGDFQWLMDRMGTDNSTAYVKSGGGSY